MPLNLINSHHLSKSSLSKVNEKNCDIIQYDKTSASPKMTVSNPPLRQNFWQHYSLAELTRSEWEALCDGCGCCCLIKYVDDDGTVDYTDVSCRLLDCETGFCQHYEQRQQYVPDCIELTLDKLPEMMWLPQHCAYKRLYLGYSLPDWHVLITKDQKKSRQQMFASNVGVAGRCVSELHFTDDEMEERVVTWVMV